ncbi:bifunctional ADP-dependent NAD(P)H-hydrate dehydratase/NAD(P)H-hydrate epimerase [Haloferax sp. Atlit-10N]|nr:bifunctional ADP-dependent NAD(P)H-hydrate dehydratase/NAD(P)H-hydrate epimerase [Haloferax sp. Atlit-19N]RDZ47469.1 bifunctional ADP-dependent NAD(P)H-hydrate dehydratase/NAD(P)H-hydrate epimerase [Haloferax sp. Atlit-16N]RDZ61305.1 bifunctional ADP-dependent NAD(P)H-hydrate dehydratase/NAD(P)H-hydrate epimerase [Haloferax sp. Atlit-10N]
MAAVDLNAEALGVPRKQLMESSGNAVARACRDLADPGASVAIVAGRGNNGGDALVAARFLKAYDVTVHLLGRPETISTDIARENWDALVAGEADRRTVTDSVAFDLGDPDLVVDAMLGTGVTGALREPEATAARAINESSATVLAVDVPSGLDADTGDAAGLAVDADRVVTFHDDKPGLVDLDCEVVVADIGIPEAAELFTGPGDLLALDRDAQSHKGDHGDVLVVGGGPYTGAPALAAQSALRAGADLARVACPEGVAREVQGYSENLIVRGFSGDRLAPEHVPDLLDFAADRDVVVFGPGLGDADESLDAVREFLAAYDGTAVVDADALQVVPEVETEATLICTPHQGELRKMGGETDADWETRRDLVREFAADLGHTLLVKGAYDVVSDGDAVRVNRTGNPGMTVGGTGDVLAGATGALAAVLPPLDAAAVAAYANGRAGDFAAEEFGGGLVATDLLERLPVGLRGDGE